MLSIVPMREEHIAAIAALERACFAHPWSEKSLREELENPQAVFRVAATSKNGVVGYAGMHVVLDECYMDNVAVRPDFRRQGAAKALVSALLGWARENGARFLTLEVRPGNVAAIALYRALCFEEVGRRPRFYTDPVEDALLMTCWLSPREGDFL